MSKNIKIKFILIALLTLMFLTLISRENRIASKIKEVEYGNTTVFELESTLDSLNYYERSLLEYYQANTLVFHIDDAILKNLNMNDYTKSNVNTMLINHIRDLYGIDVTITNTHENADLYLDTILSKQDNIIYADTPTLSNSVQVYSHNKVNQNLYALIADGQPKEIITTEEVWNYLNSEFDSHNISLVDINNDGVSDTGDLVEEYELYDLFIQEENKESIFLVRESNYHFSYMAIYDSITQDFTYFNYVFDSQYSFFGASTEVELNFFNKIFSKEMLSSYYAMTKINIYHNIIDQQIQNSSLNTNDSFLNWLNNLDTLYIGTYEGYYPYAYDINGKTEGYLVELFKNYQSLLDFYNVEVEYISYATDNFDHTMYKNFIYSNYFRLTGERNSYYYSSYYLENSYRVASTDDIKTYNSIYEIEGKIAVPTYLSDYYHIIDILPTEQIVYCDTTTKCFELLDSGKVSYYIVETEVLKYHNLLETKYHVNYVINDFNIEGYFSIPDTFEDAEYILELLNILYPTISEQSLYSQVELTLNKYVNNYLNANNMDSNHIYFVVSYFILLLVITITIIIDYRNQNANSRSQIENIVKTSNVGLFGAKITYGYAKTTRSGDIKITPDEFKLYMNINMIKTLEIGDFYLNSTEGRNYINEIDFLNTIGGYLDKERNIFVNTTKSTTLTDLFKATLEQESITIQHNTSKSNEQLFLKYTVTSSRNKQGISIDAIVNDTSYIHKKSEFFKELAFSDQLTGIFNQTKLEHDFNTLDFKYYLTINISNFKHFNTTYNRNYADELLKSFSSQIDGILSDDSNIYRIIADDFIIMSNLNTDNDVETLVHNIKELASETTVKEISTVNVETYISISYFDKTKYEDFTSFAKEYSLKLHISKSNKYGLYIPDDSLKSYDFERIIQGEVFKLKSFKNFEIFLQPKINPKDSKCIGAEALIRWNHPEYGYISPLSFLDKFEKLGKMDLLDKFVLEETCIAYNKLREENLISNDFVLSFNLSSRSILKTNFVLMITTTLDKYNIEYSNLEVEILESFDIKNYQHVTDSFFELYNKGVQIAIDDYGSGYSNVYTMSSIPFNTLKFDKSIVDNIDSNSEKYKIFNNLTEMHNTLGHKVLLEGVETQSQIDLIKDMNVFAIQGFYYSKPLPYLSFKEFLKRK